MRELTVDFSLENPLSGGAEAGYIGENNATTLIVKPGEEILATGCASYAVVFLTKNEVYRSEFFEPADEFRISLGAHLTRDYCLSLQIEGYSEENDMIFKSPMVTKIQFMPSINGDVTEFDDTEYKLYGQVANNTKARHKHENSEVINALSDENGRLLYNGEPIQGAEKTKTVELSYEKGEIECTFAPTESNTLSFVTYESDINSVMPADAEIKKVEVNIDSKDCPEWLDLREFSLLDDQNPCIISMCRPYYDETLLTNVFCKIHSVVGLNKFIGYINAYLLRKIRITYIEKSVD